MLQLFFTDFSFPCEGERTSDRAGCHAGNCSLVAHIRPVLIEITIAVRVRVAAVVVRTEQLLQIGCGAVEVIVTEVGPRFQVRYAIAYHAESESVL